MRSADDLTARARIRDAALARFAEQGAGGATMRDIAERAGVSLALVQYHFASKNGLREACDAYVTEYVRAMVQQVADENRLAEPEFVAAAQQNGPPVLRYHGRALADGSPGAAALFDELVALTESALPAGKDARAGAAVFVAMRLGVYVLHGHLSRALGVDAMSPEGLARIAAAQLEIVAPEFVGASALDQARTGLARYRDGDDG